MTTLNGHSLRAAPRVETALVRDWETFVEEVSWFLPAGVAAEVGEERPSQRAAVPGLPVLSSLIGVGMVTPVLVSGQHYELIAWGPPHARRGWLVLPPPDVPVEKRVHPVHEQFWTLCGGIVEQFGGPSTWWDNQNEVLTVAATHQFFARVLEDYRWLWDGEGLQIPIDAGDYYVVAVEANGNLTLAHRRSGALLLFAPDHDFDGVTPLPGCPPYSLLRVDSLPDLTSWIEACAGAWRS